MQRPIHSFLRARTLPMALGCALLVLAGCAGPQASGPVPPAATQAAPWPERLHHLLPADVLLLGEQHDAPDHQRLQREAVLWLAARGQLAALVMEMAESGHSTQSLPQGATEAQAQAALQWNDAAWPWKAYGPVVMAAVAAGVPVLGGNLPRAQMRAAMQEPAWDRHLPPAALARQITALRDGHCGLLPEPQLAPMARIQIARDASMARTAQQALRPGQTVLLVAGGGHVLRSLGVPTHWPENLKSKVALARVQHAQSAIETEASQTTGTGAIAPADADADVVIDTPALPPRDACAELREQWRAAPRGQR
ncbi:MAG: ChaN family lipoprotein [Acidovorax sp.]|uniref:ChaN family lipoprotein n=1 Tax=Acidovorax sp. TaxID=1872122 RepID=UPI0022BE3CEC|nr:ChaN family lipoprotein [Acidovorax sp.]MCZ8219888.1 ChaN family lipoprotein [Acidovorax sp.]